MRPVCGYHPAQKGSVSGSVEATSVVQEGAEKGQTTENEKESSEQAKNDETTLAAQGEAIGVSDEIYEFMQEFMVFPVIWDFDQQDMSGAVDYFAQKWVWTDVSAMEYDAERKAYYVNFKDFIQEMSRYFVLPPSYEWREGVSINAGMWLVADLEMLILFERLEQAGIWYMPLKGTVLKDNYPEFGMRQMSDHDILFDAGRADEVRVIMEDMGYSTEAFGRGCHDSYHKEPVCNFEMHMGESKRYKEITRMAEI